MPVVAYIDGGARGNPGPAGYGVRVEDSTGTLLDELRESIGVATNNVAEYRGLLAALRYLEERGYRDVTIRSDSQLLTRQMLGQYRVRHPTLQALYKEACGLVGRIGHVRFEHVPRAENAEADRLANLAMDDASGRVTTSPASRGTNPSEPTVTLLPGELPQGAVLTVGVDVESIARIDDLLQRYGRRFLQRVFTREEIDYSLARRFPAQHLAGRFCAKEAAMKALGTGRTPEVRWTDVEVVRPSGPPQLRLHGGAARRSTELGAGRALLSITHAGDFAFAQVLLLKA